MKYILQITLFLALLFTSCVKTIPIGFLSDNISMREDTFQVIKGAYTVSSIPLIDGSTRPLKFEILDIRNLDTGNKAEEFFKTYPVRLWSSPYDPDEDTSMELVNKKLVISDISPIDINSASGQIALNGGTQNLTGTRYAIDVKISNENTSKIYKDYGTIKLISKPWEVMNNFGEYFYGMVPTDETPQKNIEIRNPLPTIEMEQVRKGTHPNFSIKKVGESDDVQVTLSFYDSRDAVFPGKAIAKWPSGASYLNSWFDNSVETKVLEDKIEFNFPTVPFPAFGRQYTGNRESISLSYYVLHPDYYELTPAAKAIADKKASEIGKVFRGYNLQAKIAYQINEPGVWEVKVKFRNAIKK